MDGYLINPLEFLVNVLLQFYLLAVMLRFLLQLVRADFYNPVSQFLVKITNPLLRPLRRMIPGYAGIDLASLVLAYLVALAAVVLTGFDVGIARIPGLLRGSFPGITAVLLGPMVDLLALTFNIFIFGIIIQAILSWVNPGTYNAATAMLYALNDPVLRPVRRIVPPISGLDLSPLVAIIGLQVVKMLVIPPLQYVIAGGAMNGMVPLVG